MLQRNNEKYNFVSLMTASLVYGYKTAISSFKCGLMCFGFASLQGKGRLHSKLAVKSFFLSKAILN